MLRATQVPADIAKQTRRKNHSIFRIAGYGSGSADGATTETRAGNDVANRPRGRIEYLRETRKRYQYSHQKNNSFHLKPFSNL